MALQTLFPEYLTEKKRIICPAAHARTVEVSSKSTLPILEQEGFPGYDRKSIIDPEKCRR